MYKVIADFVDLQDQNYSYKFGDTFPREGIKISSSRYEELSSNKNRRGKPLIEEVKEPKKTRSKKSSTE